MKRILIFSVALLLLSGCGVGNYSVSYGNDEEASISFVYQDKVPITVTVDNNTYQINSVKDKAFKTDRKIKQTALNTIKIMPGTHDVKVEMEGNAVYSRKLYISAYEHKIVEL